MSLEKFADLKIDPEAGPSSMSGELSIGDFVDDQDPDHEDRYLENGRGYGQYRKGVYIQPCDERECDRLDIMHTLFKTVRDKDNRLLNAPFREAKPSVTGEGSRVLDLGCGTGIWLLDMAEKYKETEFVGVDFNNMGPDTLLPKVDIKVPFDYESPWTMGMGTWDLIHLQMGRGSVSSWPKLYQKILKHLKPGGWFESVEVDLIPRCDSHPEGILKEGAMRDWYGYLHQAYSVVNRQLKLPPDDEIESDLKKTGFLNIGHKKYRLPLHPWPPEVIDKLQHRAGFWYHIAMGKGQQEADGRWNGGFGFEAIGLAALTRIYEWSEETAQNLIRAAMDQASQQNLHVYHELHVWTARAPRQGEAR